VGRRRDDEVNSPVRAAAIAPMLKPHTEVRTMPQASVLGAGADAGPRPQTTRDLSHPLDRRELVCSVCGYGVVLDRRPDRCPMCGGAQWQLAADTLREAAP